MTIQSVAEKGVPAAADDNTPLKAYILFDIEPCFIERARRILQMEQVVESIDVMDGSPNVIAITSAGNSNDLANGAMQAILTMQGYINSVRFLPVRV